jgi:hypothetical protein
MLRVGPLRFCAAVLVLLCARSGSGAEAVDRVARTLALPSDRAIRLEATVADVTIIGSNRPDVAVEVVRRAPQQADLRKFPVAIDSTSAGIRIGVTQLDDGRDARLKAEIVVHAPAGALFDAVRVFEGRVRVSALTAGCDVDLRRGPIEATAVAGRIRLESGIASVEVRDATLTPAGMLRLRVFNGAIRVHFAARPASARILAVTFNGTLSSDIPLTMRDSFGPRFGEATLGSGEPVLSIDVVTGNISITVGNR